MAKNHFFTRLNGANSFLLIMFASVISALLAGCDQPNASVPQPSNTIPVEIAPIQVIVSVPEIAKLVEPIYATGTILAHKSTNIVPMVGGLVEEVLVGVGDRVKKGQPLLRLRQRDFELNVERLTQATLLASAEMSNARRDMENAVELVKKGALSQEQLDDRRTRYESTSAQLGMAKSNLEQGNQELDDSITKAPFDGVVTQRNVDEGAYVATMMRGNQPVLQIQKIDIMVAVIYVPEAHLKALSVGMPGTVHIGGIGKSYNTKVHLINDRIDVNTRSIDVRLGILNADYEIKPGLFIEVELFPDARSATVLPMTVVRGMGGDRYVFVFQNGVAKRQRVQIRELESGQAEILSGLGPDELVILGPDLSLIKDNVRVVHRAAG